MSSTQKQMINDFLGMCVNILVEASLKHIEAQSSLKSSLLNRDTDKAIDMEEVDGTWQMKE